VDLASLLLLMPVWILTSEWAWETQETELPQATCKLVSEKQMLIVGWHWDSEAVCYATIVASTIVNLKCRLENIKCLWCLLSLRAYMDIAERMEHRELTWTSGWLFLKWRLKGGWEDIEISPKICFYEPSMLLLKPEDDCVRKKKRNWSSLKSIVSLPLSPSYRVCCFLLLISVSNSAA
jgi:hypothetical protein